MLIKSSLLISEIVDNLQEADVTCACCDDDNVDNLVICSSVTDEFILLDDWGSVALSVVVVDGGQTVDINCSLLRKFSRISELLPPIKESMQSFFSTREDLLIAGWIETMSRILVSFCGTRRKCV